MADFFSETQNDPFGVVTIIKVVFIRRSNLVCYDCDFGCVQREIGLLFSLSPQFHIMSADKLNVFFVPGRTREADVPIPSRFFIHKAYHIFLLNRNTKRTLIFDLRRHNYLLGQVLNYGWLGIPLGDVMARCPKSVYRSSDAPKKFWLCWQRNRIKYVFLTKDTLEKERHEHLILSNSTQGKISTVLESH